MPDWNVTNTSAISSEDLNLVTDGSGYQDPGSQTPQLMTMYPLPGATGVAVNTPVVVDVYCPGMLAPFVGWSRLKVANFDVVIASSVGDVISSNLTDTLGAKYTETNDVHTIRSLYRNFDYETTYTISGGARGDANLLAEWEWSFTTGSNEAYYDGHTPLAIEIALQAPFTTFLDLEPLRKTFLEHALRPNVPMYDRQAQSQSTNKAQSILAKDNKAVRVLYQHAFTTELKTLQNRYGTKDTNALATVVAEKTNTIDIDKALMPLKDHLIKGIQALHTAKVYPEEYATTFMDYLDSTLYTYRVSLVANILLMAKAVELQNA